MENEKRLIDANALIEKMKDHHDFFVDGVGGFRYLTPKDKARVDEITHCIAEIVNAPTVDAVVLPCKIGDTAWGIRLYHGVLVPRKGRVSEMYFTTDMQLRIVVFNASRGEWGKDVFATKEEAEAAIQKKLGVKEK